MVEVVTHNNNDLILSRWDNINILQGKGPTLLTQLPDGWLLDVNGSHSINSLYSPILSKTDDIEAEVQKVYESIQKFINILNKDGHTVSRIECKLLQSNNNLALPHPDNYNNQSNRLENNKGTDDYITNGDYKFSKYIFTDHFKVADGNDQVYGNKFSRECQKNLKSLVKKKYYILVIESAWRSI